MFGWLLLAFPVYLLVNGKLAAFLTLAGSAPVVATNSSGSTISTYNSSEIKDQFDMLGKEYQLNKSSGDTGIPSTEVNLP